MSYLRLLSDEQNRYEVEKCKLRGGHFYRFVTDVLKFWINWMYGYGYEEWKNIHCVNQSIERMTALYISGVKDRCKW